MVVVVSTARPETLTGQQAPLEPCRHWSAEEEAEMLLLERGNLLGYTGNGLVKLHFSGAHPCSKPKSDVCLSCKSELQASASFCGPPAIDEAILMLSIASSRLSKDFILEIL